jgi:2-oxoisovalerate dehydrogenase E1 component
MPGFTVDGNDVLEIHRVAGEAVRRARSGEGPTLIECKTYRTRAHAEGMGDFTYRTREDVDAWKQKCPIARLKHAALNGNSLSGEERPTNDAPFDAIDREVAQLVKEGREFAESSPYPTGESASTHVYAEPAAATPPRNPLVPTGGRQITYTQATHEKRWPKR